MTHGQKSLTFSSYICWFSGLPLICIAGVRVAFFPVFGFHLNLSENRVGAIALDLGVLNEVRNVASLPFVAPRKGHGAGRHVSGGQTADVHQASAGVRRAWLKRKHSGLRLHAWALGREKAQLHFSIPLFCSRQFPILEQSGKELETAWNSEVLYIHLKILHNRRCFTEWHKTGNKNSGRKLTIII